MPAPSASNTGCCSSPTPSNNTTSAWRKSTTGSGPSTLLASCSHASTNATTSSGTDTLTPTQCYPCSRFTLLPMFPVAHDRVMAAGPRPEPAPGECGQKGEQFPARPEEEQRPSVVEGASRDPPLHGYRPGPPEQRVPEEQQRCSDPP